MCAQVRHDVNSCDAFVSAENYALICWKDLKPGASTKSLKQVLRDDACLEYVVVPWSTNEEHSDEVLTPCTCEIAQET